MSLRDTQELGETIEQYEALSEQLIDMGVSCYHRALKLREQRGTAEDMKWISAHPAHVIEDMTERTR